MTLPDCSVCETAKKKFVQLVKEAKMGSNERQGPSWKEEIVQFVKEAKMGSSE